MLLRTFNVKSILVLYLLFERLELFLAVSAEGYLGKKCSNMVLFSGQVCYFIDIFRRWWIPTEFKVSAQNVIDNRARNNQFRKQQRLGV